VCRALCFALLLVVVAWPATEAQAACDERCDAACSSCCKAWSVVATCEGSTVAVDSSYASRASATRVANWLNQRAAGCSSGAACEGVRVECSGGRGVALWQVACAPGDQLQDPALLGTGASQLEAGKRWTRAALQAVDDAQVSLASYRARADATARGRTKADGLAAELARLKVSLNTMLARLTQSEPSADIKKLTTDQTELVRKAGDIVAQGQKLLDAPDSLDAKFAQKQQEREQQQQRKLAEEQRKREKAEQQRQEQERRASAREEEKRAAEERRHADADAKALATAAKEQQSQAKALADATNERNRALGSVAQASNQADAGMLSAAKLLAGQDLSTADRSAVSDARGDLEKAKASLARSFSALKASSNESSGQRQLEQVRKLQADVAKSSADVDAARARVLKVIQRRARKQ
jgi:hypothetical protein